METPIEELSTGSMFAGRYQIIEELGRGGMGKVYRALDKKLNEEVALKLIKPEIASDKKTLERFSNELKIARKISHRNIGRVYEMMEEKGTHFITMEYVPGEDLKSFIRRSGRIDIPKVLFTGKQVSDGLTEAHKQGVVHRDLKPSNIMIDKQGDARIMDFGIARLLKAKGITGAGIMIGTPEYMSPEQVESKEVDQRSDIYSLGIILYEMVTGQVPFEGDTPFSVGMKQKGEAPPDPKKINAQIPDDLNSLILKCLEKDRDQRFQSAGEVRSELERIEKGLPTTEKTVSRKKPITSREITVKFSLNKPLRWGFIFAAVVIAGLLIWRLLPKKQPFLAPKIENSIAVISFENQTGDQSYDFLQKAIPNLLITNLERTGELYVATWERMHDLLKQMGQKDVDVIDRDLGFELCRREGIESIVTGSFVKAGDTFVTDVKVLDVETKKLLKGANVRGRGEDSILQTQIDELGREISLGLGIARQELEANQLSITNITTSSMEAYKYYLQGKEEIQNLNILRARQFLEKAVELDPRFAMAHLYLGNTYREMGNRESALDAYKMAKLYSENATEKERLHIEVVFAQWVERDNEKRFRLLEEWTAKYPREKDAHYEFGLYYYNRHRDDEAILEIQKALKLDPDMGAALNMLAYIYADRGDYERALEIFQRYAQAMPGVPNPLDSMAELYFKMGKLDEAIEKYNETMAVEPTFGCEFRLAYIYALKQDYPEALRQIERFTSLVPPAGIKAAGYVLTGIFDFLLGKREKAFDDLRMAEEWADKAGDETRKAAVNYMRGWMHYELGEFDLSEEHLQKWADVLLGLYPDSKNWRVWHRFCLGLLYVKQNKMVEAKGILDEIESIIAQLEAADVLTWIKVRRDWLRSEISMAEGSPEEAIQIVKSIEYPPIPTLQIDPIMIYNMPFLQDTLARAYHENGQLDEGIAEYERKVRFDPQSDDRRLIHPKYYYLLAKLYEEKGDTAKAVEHYERFLELWKDADTGLPELEEAKKRLALLTKE